MKGDAGQPGLPGRSVSRSLDKIMSFYTFHDVDWLLDICL